MRRAGESVRGLARRIGDLEWALTGLERRLVTAQEKYEALAGELAGLRSLARQLASHGLRPGDTESWASVCRALDWPASSGSSHQMVRRRDPALHALLHRAAFPPHCALDQATYAD